MEDYKVSDIKLAEWGRKNSNRRDRNAWAHETKRRIQV